jgi:hypothetical protein
VATNWLPFMQAWQGFLPCTTLLPPLHLLITVTFSTPTPDYVNYPVRTFPYLVMQDRFRRTPTFDGN